MIFIYFYRPNSAELNSNSKTFVSVFILEVVQVQSSHMLTIVLNQQILNIVPPIHINQQLLLNYMIAKLLNQQMFNMKVDIKAPLLMSRLSKNQPLFPNHQIQYEIDLSVGNNRIKPRSINNHHEHIEIKEEQKQNLKNNDETNKFKY